MYDVNIFVQEENKQIYTVIWTTFLCCIHM